MKAAYLSKRPVSIAERLVPCLGFAFAAVGGLAGSYQSYRLFSETSTMQLPSDVILTTGITSIDMFVGGTLASAATMVLFGIILSLLRLIVAEKTASPPGWLLFVCGIVCLLPAAMLAYVLNLPRPAFLGAQAGTIGATARIIGPILITACILGIVGIVGAAAFSFARLSAKSGRKITPALAQMAIEAILALLCVMFFFQLQDLAKPSFVY